jgi:anti-sigma-K factor RskA
MSGAGTPGSGDGEQTLDVLAGEYVLGLLDAAAARTVEGRARHDAALAAAIAHWQSRFDPLADLAAPAAPSHALWSRIAADLVPAPAAAAPVLTLHKPPAAPMPRPSAWRGAALASMALAAGLAAFIVWSRLSGTPAAPFPLAVALLAAPGSAAATLRAQVTAAGTITVVPLQHLQVAAGHRLGFWAWPATEKQPVLLGMMPASGGQMRFPYPAREGTPVMVTLEGDAPPAHPGPTLYLGLLVAGPA